MKVLIIENDRKSALDLVATLGEVDTNIEVTAILDSVEVAIERLSTGPQPDVAFLDVQLSDGLSFEIFSKVEVRCPIIFCSAFDEHAILFFKKRDIIYILKPYNRAKVEKALHQVFHYYQPFESNHFILLTQYRK